MPCMSVAEGHLQSASGVLPRHAECTAEQFTNRSTTMQIKIGTKNAFELRNLLRKMLRHFSALFGPLNNFFWVQNFPARSLPNFLPCNLNRKRKTASFHQRASAGWTRTNLMGHPQNCVQTYMWLDIGSVSGKAPLPGQGLWETPSPKQSLSFSPRLRPMEFEGGKADTLCTYETPCPGRGALPDTIAANIVTERPLLKKCLGESILYFTTTVKLTKQSLYKAKSLACSLANRDTLVAATLQRKSSGGSLFCNHSKDCYKINVPRKSPIIWPGWYIVNPQVWGCPISKIAHVVSWACQPVMPIEVVYD